MSSNLPDITLKDVDRHESNSASSALAPSGERIVIAHGGGGELTAALVREHFLPRLTNQHLTPLADSAVLPWSESRLVFTTDSYVVTPLEFPGGDIGRLAVCGTVNDLAVMGAQPVALSLGVILEEGLPLEVLDRIVASISSACREGDAQRSAPWWPCIAILAACAGSIRMPAWNCASASMKRAIATMAGWSP